ncbi:hypothetical protein J4Q44_G00158780 [Coregonus suidteri]|uniref:EGF-like domain-containing protein n=1 Tax=Coregonus suidteri TaxID=861788 RepID=A0AAN8QS42_9TELE
MMPLPRTHLLALLAAICVAEPLTTPHGSDNEVLKLTEASLTKSQNLEIENAIGNFSRTEQGDGPTATPAASFTTTSTPSPAPTPTPTPKCPGNQVALVGSEGCGCPVGMVNIGGEICTCPVGYTLQGVSECIDTDECKVEGPGPCSLHANCTNTPGSYLCKCLRGYLMGAGGCQDIDECALAEVTGLQACGSGADCRNSPGSFSCSCPVGYVMALDGHSCVDVDECSFEEQCRRELGNLCVNTPGSFMCQCQPGFRAEVPACIGYRGNGTYCEDENECASGHHGCDTNARCGNIIGSYFCQCYQGFNGDGYSCFDVDECALSNGHCEHNCTNEPGGYSCHCGTGYQLAQDGQNCTDVDECVVQNGTCEQVCTNTQGSFLCSCRPGYQLHIDRHSCVDINECKLENGALLPHLHQHTRGTHVFLSRPSTAARGQYHLCHVCFISWVDVTSCDFRKGGCDHVCTVRAEGLLYCSCSAGWELGKDLRSCLDVNECGDFTNGGCEQLCQNHPGGFNCSCREGYVSRTDDPTKCQHVCDPPCQNYGACVAPHTCDCPAGYPGPGCSAMCSPPCAHGGTCMRWNMCLCPPGWTGTGCHTAVCELPCANGGRCVGPEICQCPSDYTGPQCLSPLCTPACQNGGRCVDVNKCTCVGGWQGARCQIEPVQCQKPCKNGGVCVGLNRCRCASDFTGSLCETAVTTPCVPPCQHGATCSPHNKCTCPEGTAGIRCERLTCPVVTTVVSMARAVRKGVRESYADRCGPLGVQLCTKYRINQARVYLQAYRVGYRVQCPEKKGR